VSSSRNVAVCCKVTILVCYIRATFRPRKWVTVPGSRGSTIDLKWACNLSRAGVAQSVQWLDYGLYDRGSIQGKVNYGIFSLRYGAQTDSEAHPPFYLMGTETITLEVKRPGREADHSPPSSTETKNAWSYTSTHQYVFMTWCLVKHRDNLIFTCCLSRILLPFESFLLPAEL
jgi:hypothetical protein